MKRLFVLALATFLFCSSGFAQNTPATLVVDETDRQEVVEQTIPIDRVWAGHPVGFALLTEGPRQYIAYYNADRLMTVGQRNIDDPKFTLYTLPPKERTAREGTSTTLGWDSHNYLTLAVDQEGYIHMSGNMHVNGLTYFRSAKPHDITTLTQVPAMVGTEENRCTYPRFMKTQDGELIFRYRDGGSGNGNDIYNSYDCRTQKWTRLVDTPMTDGQGLMNAYASQPQRRADGWYHMYWVWRDTPDCSTNHDLSYMKSPDMRNWFDVYGRPIRLPATLDQRSLIVDPIPPQGGIINLAAKLCLDDDHTPIFAYHKYDSAGNLQFYTARFSGGGWTVKQVTNWDYRWAFSGPGSINSEVRIGDFKKRPDGFYELGYSHVKYGTGTLLLNADLELAGQVEKPAPATELAKVEGDFPGLFVQTENDLGHSGEPAVRYLLKWETLDRNRDRPRPEPWPGPSQLYLYQLRTPAKKWTEIKTVEDLYAAYPDRLKAMLQQFDLERAGLKEVKAAVAQDNIPLACRRLLDYYENAVAEQTLPSPSDQKDPEADSLLQDIYTFYRLPDRVPRHPDGRLDWHYRGPDDDIEWAWGLNRHYHIRALLEAYLKTGNLRYADRIDQDIKDWVLGSLPYPGVKSSTAMWRGLEVSFRIKTWAQIFRSLQRSPALSPATRLLILSSMPEHAHYQRNFHAQGNWLTMEMTGLATVAATWPEFQESPVWMAYAKEAMLESLKEQIYPDGVQTELTAHYHYVALNNFNQLLEICRLAEEPLPEAYLKEIEKMWNYLAYSMRPDGNNVLNNDSDLRNYQNLVSAAADQFEREDWRYLATNGREGARPQGPPSVVFPWAGQQVMRSGYDADAQWAFFDIGPWGSGHQHNDKLHLSVSAFGRDLLVDGGRFAYRGSFADKFRRYAVGSESHNVMLIDGQGQGPGPRTADQPLPQDRFTTTEDFDYAWGDFDQFRDVEGQVRHSRALYYQRGKFWIVVDRVTTDRPRKIEALWHWHPACQVETGDNQVVYSNNPRGNLSVIPVGDSNWRINLVKGREEPAPQGWYSREYNEATPNVASIFATETDQDNTFVWILYPSEGKAPEVKAKLLSQQADGVTVRVRSEDGRWKIFVPYADSGLTGN